MPPKKRGGDKPIAEALKADNLDEDTPLSPPKKTKRNETVKKESKVTAKKVKSATAELPNDKAKVSPKKRGEKPIAAPKARKENNVGENTASAAPKKTKKNETVTKESKAKTNKVKPAPAELPNEVKKESKTRGKKIKIPSPELPNEEPKPDRATSKRGNKAQPIPQKDTTSSTSNENGVNQTKTHWESIDFQCKKKNSDGSLSNTKITSWNVDGVRAWMKKDGLKILDHEAPDIFCLQETRCTEESLPDDLKKLKGYYKYWCSSDKSGYAGVGLLSKKEPINVIYGINDEEQDQDGRCITAEFDKFFLVSVYVPNAGRKLVTLDKRLTWNDLFKDFIQELDAKKPVILCGDLNVAHNEIDLKNPKTNTKNAGFTKEERDGMSDFLEAGFVDTFRAFYPDMENVYTFWTYMGGARKKNVGWRLDYFLVSNRVENKICDTVVRDKVFGSDHCPITLFINI